MTQLCKYALDISQSSKRGGTETLVSGAFFTRTFILRLTSTSTSSSEGATTIRVLQRH